MRLEPAAKRRLRREVVRLHGRPAGFSARTPNDLPPIFVLSFNIMLNLKFALRTLFKTPFVTIVAIVSLALGIGANAAIFSLFNQLLLQPLAVPQANRLINLTAPPPKPGSTSCNQAGDCDTVF